MTEWYTVKYNNISMAINGKSYVKSLIASLRAKGVENIKVFDLENKEVIF